MSEEGFDTDWPALVAEGRFVQARAVARIVGAEATELAAVETLAQIQEFAREKSWARALGRVEKLHELAAPIDVAAFATEVRILRDASAHLDRRESEEALGRLEELESPYLIAEVATQKGTALVLQNELGPALEAFEEAVEHDPRHYRAITNLGNIALEEGDVDAAIEAYERALAIDDSFANAHHNLGVALRRKGQVGRSVRALRRAQKAMQQQDAERARDSVKGVPGVKWGRWIAIGAVAVLLYLVLQQRGVI